MVSTYYNSNRIGSSAAYRILSFYCIVIEIMYGGLQVLPKSPVCQSSFRTGVWQDRCSGSAQDPNERQSRKFPIVLHSPRGRGGTFLPREFTFLNFCTSDKWYLGDLEYTVVSLFISILGELHQ